MWPTPPSNSCCARHHVLDEVLVLGLTFKENCPDVRNTKVVDIVRTLQAYHAQVDIYDPWIDTHKRNTNTVCNA